MLTHPEILSIRVDESLYFANSLFLEDTIAAQIAERPQLKNVILFGGQCDRRLGAGKPRGNQPAPQRCRMGFHLSEIKGPVVDRLKDTEFLRHLNGTIHLSQHAAVAPLRP